MRRATFRVTVLAVVAAGAVPALAAAAESENPTFHKDIEPILQRSCQVCHRPGG